MLNFDVKRKINNLRDILVGKVPDPKAQVEQITIALIYKFMDDMDLEGMEFGASREFFKEDYEKYAWTNIMQPENSGQQRANLYAEGIDKMSMNPHLPQLFRDIFRGAYVPYRDAETLNMFLKEINDFNYDHSEELGNAFEYLLSIMGSQGDAGQFRTPRHIIDMIVEIVDPQKTDSILDPACGTAGFLISSYKHILEKNKDKDGINTLSADERKRMTENFAGYDISPDMVRLSRVNMYLHKFTKPHISEYDTLSSLDKWDEAYDVILANPPFMTPKGGIIPHNRYQIQAKRAEVLFVDYIAEHLNPTGKAGVIVPEGIVFQSTNAYKNLRKYLVEDDLLYAVISLPAGVFNPYSGVKTSILLMDKTLAKQKDEILFVKINNDGYDLGAQRREINGSDIPKVTKVIRDYQGGIDVSDNALVTIVSKKDIADQDYILVGERYKESVVVNSDYPMMEIEKLINNVKYPEKLLKSEFLDKGQFPIIDQSENYIAGYSNNPNLVFNISKPVICFGDHTRALKYVDFNFVLGADGVKILEPIDEVNSKYLYYCLSNTEIPSLGYSRHFKVLKEIQIPIPPLHIQEEIIKEIEGYQKIIDGAKQVVENFKPIIKIDPSWEMVKLGDVCELATGATPLTSKDENYKNGTIKWLVSGDINQEIIYDCVGRVTEKGKESARLKIHQSNSVMIALNGQGKTRGTVALLKTEATCNQSLVAINPKNELILSTEFLLYVLKGMYQDIRNITGDTQRSGLNMPIIRNFNIPLPTIEIQHQIVSKINEEVAIVEQNKRLIEIYEQKIKDRISDVWGE
ncbi:N-6 DNA methylase [Sedimentibacter saalensis]|uniref:N-6 DNA methylase n=1 Tax=Sedimentibacter saalensis TaxID=130788 RepID=UPI0028A01730|nr:N-6 DNA methylase [Sedimentibacter saalensis]